MKRKRNRIWRRILFFGFLFLAVLLVFRLWMYAESFLFFRHMRGSVELQESGEPDEEGQEPQPSDGTGPDPAPDPDMDSTGEFSGKGWPADGMKIDWKRFRGTDVAAWLRFGSISYPVMQGKDNSYYLHRLPDGRINPGGSLFLLAENNVRLRDRNSVIYGHNMADGSMFGKLERLKNKSASANYFDLYLPDGSLHRYALFAILCVPSDADAFTIGFPDAEDFVLWQKEMQMLSVRRCAAPVTETGRLATLVTCDGPAGTSRRLAVMGKEMRVWKQSGGETAEEEKEPYEEKEAKEERKA